jgi:hypothetical protein
MFAVKGIYSGERTVRLEKAAPVNEGYEVIVTFVSPPRQTEANHILENEKDLAERQAGFAQFMKYHKTLRADFDYKKELIAYREERYGRTN